MMELGGREEFMLLKGFCRTARAGERGPVLQWGTLSTDEACWNNRARVNNPLDGTRAQLIFVQQG
jgi:hypothetical protein